VYVRKEKKMTEFTRVFRLLAQLRTSLLKVPQEYQSEALKRLASLTSALERAENQLEMKQNELVQAYQRLEASEARLKMILENMPVIVGAADEQGQIFMGNREFERITGYSMQEIINNPAALGLLFPDPDYLNHLLQEWQEMGGVCRDWEIVLTCKNGSKHVISVSSVAGDFPVMGWTNWSVGVDITRQKQAEQRTKLLQELIGELSKAVTPLQVSEVIVDQALRALNAHRGLVATLNEAGRFLVLLNKTGMPSETANEARCIPLDYPGPLAEAARTSAPVWIETREEFINRYPKLAEMLAETGSQSGVYLPLMIAERIIGAIGFTFAKPRQFTEEDQGLFLALATHCAQALERAQLYESQQATVTVQERQRLARELHDSISQTLFAADMMAQSLIRQWQRKPEVVPRRLEELQHLTSSALAEMRSFLLGMQPARLADISLEELLKQLAQSLGAKTHIRVKVISEGDFQPPPEIKLALYLIAQEALMNVAKHAQATETVVSLKSPPGQVILGVVDNGRGFDPAEVTPLNMGLSTMRERAMEIGAEFTIQTNPGRGTQIWVQWHGDTLVDDTP